MSEQMKHTPGTWFVEDDFTVSSDHGQEICCCLSADDLLCLEEGTGDHMSDEANANARLIAAAPDMLNALMATRIYVEVLEKLLDPTVDPGAPTIREHAAMLRAAIAKATGSAPEKEG